MKKFIDIVFPDLDDKNVRIELEPRDFADCLSHKQHPMNSYSPKKP